MTSVILKSLALLFFRYTFNFYQKFLGTPWNFWKIFMRCRTRGFVVVLSPHPVCIVSVYSNNMYYVQTYLNLFSGTIAPKNNFTSLYGRSGGLCLYFSCRLYFRGIFIIIIVGWCSLFGSASGSLCLPVSAL